MCIYEEDINMNNSTIKSNEDLIERCWYCKKINEKITQKFSLDNNANESDMSRTEVKKMAQTALERIITELKGQIPDFSFSEYIDRIIFEALFYNLIYNAYKLMLLSSDNGTEIDVSNILNFESVNDFLGEEMYKYISCIYNIFFIQFIKCDFAISPINWNTGKQADTPVDINYNYSSIYKVYEKDNLKAIQQKAQEALNIYSDGEIATRLLFLSHLAYSEYYPLENHNDFLNFLENHLDYHSNITYNVLTRNTFTDNCYPIVRDINYSSFARYDAELSSNPLYISIFPYYEDMDKSEISIDSKESLFDALFFLPLSTNMNPDFLELLAEQAKQKGELKKQNDELEKTKKEKEYLIKQREDLIASHAHTWKHFIYPDTIKEVAQELLPNNPDAANKLFNAYNSEYLLRQNLNMLTLRYTSNTSEKIKSIKETIYPADYPFEGIKTKQVVDTCLETVLFQLLMKDYDTRIHIKDLIAKIDLFENIQLIREQFTNDIVLKRTNSDCITWFNNNFYPLSVSYSEFWNDLSLAEHDTAHLQLSDWIINLFHNAINHGMKNKHGNIELLFDEEIIEENDYLTITIKNLYAEDNDVPFELGTGKGLQFINSVLCEYNNECYNKKIGVTTAIDKNTFITKLYIAKTIFCPEG